MPQFDAASNSTVIDSILHDIQGNQYNINIESINLDALNHASGQFPNIEEYKAVLEVLFDRLKTIVLEIDGQRSQAPLTTTDVEIENVNRACERVDEVVTTLAAKDPAWRQANSGEIISQLRSAEDAVKLARQTLQLDGIFDTHSPGTQIEAAQHSPTPSQQVTVTSLGKMMITDVPREKIVAVKHFLVLSKTDEGNKQLLAEPGLLQFLVDLMNTAMSQEKSVAIECLENISVSDNGRNYLLAEPELVTVTVLADMLESTSITIDGKSKTIKCLQNLALSDNGRQQLLEVYGLVRSLAQILASATGDAGRLKAVAAECLQILAQSDHGKECLLEVPELLQSLANMIISDNLNDKIAAARCFEHLLSSDQAKQAARFHGIPHGLVQLLNSPKAEAKSAAAGCFSFLATEDPGIVTTYSLARPLTDIIAKGTPEAKFKAAQCIHAIGSSNWGKHELLKESQLIRCLERMVATAATDGKNMALECLQILT